MSPRRAAHSFPLGRRTITDVRIEYLDEHLDAICQRQGIGLALCIRAAEEARRLGMSNLYLFTFDKQSMYRRLDWIGAMYPSSGRGSAAGQSMYRRLGWSVLGNARNSDRACTIMGRRLDPDVDSGD